MLQHPFSVEDELRRKHAERLAKAQREVWLRAGLPKPPGWRRRLARLLIGAAVRLDDALARTQMATLPGPGCADCDSQQAQPPQR